MPSATKDTPHARTSTHYRAGVNLHSSSRGPNPSSGQTGLLLLASMARGNHLQRAQSSAGHLPQSGLQVVTPP